MMWRADWHVSNSHVSARYASGGEIKQWAAFFMLVKREWQCLVLKIELLVYAVFLNGNEV
ncbi:hypothetical protein EMIT091MI3_70123 [Kosakonia quasisacchari]